MNYQTALTMLIEQLKNDKNTNPKWRNKIVSRLEETEAMLHKLHSREATKADMESLAATAPETPTRCTCKGAGAADINCPVHGL